MAVIYQITNMVNGKFYIGSADSFARREWQHKYDLKRGAHKNPHLQASWNKYGADAFVFEVLEVVPEGESQLAWENRYLHIHAAKSNCYNINQNAELPRLGVLHTEETKKKTSRSRMGKAAGADHYRYGQTVSDETKQKIGDTQRGVSKAPRVFTPEGLKRAQENMKRNAKPQLPVGFDAVHAKFPADVQARYDFSNAVYTGALARITGVVCAQHGIFSQYAAQFRKGSGCPECGAILRAESKKAQMLLAWGDAEQRATMLAAREKHLAPTPAS
jgi:group I intron endonuclease